MTTGLVPVRPQPGRERTPSQVADWDTVTLSVTVTGTVPGCHGLASQVDWQVKLGLTDSDAALSGAAGFKASAAVK